MPHYNPFVNIMARCARSSGAWQEESGEEPSPKTIPNYVKPARRGTRVPLAISGKTLKEVKACTKPERESLPIDGLVASCEAIKVRRKGKTIRHTSHYLFNVGGSAVSIHADNKVNAYRLFREKMGLDRVPINALMFIDGKAV